MNNHYQLKTHIYNLSLKKRGWKPYKKSSSRLIAICLDENAISNMQDKYAATTG